MTTIGTTRARLRAATTVAAIAALLGALTAAPAQADDPADMFCEVPGQELAISPVSGLSDGQAVTWLSTVKGTAPTTFTGEYIGKLDNGLGYDAYGNPRDLLLVRLSGPEVDGAAGTPAAGVWAGASGSPVYDADGALIGAVSYGFSSLADNVAGVTPAAYMKAIGDLPLSRSLTLSAQKKIATLAGEPAPTASSTASIRQLRPVRVTVGTTAATLDAVASRLSKEVDGYRPVVSRGLAIGGGADDGADYPIVTGGNIAVSYGFGAVASASIGTVTAVCGDDVYAFGHPNEQNSALSVNIHGASAARIVPDLGQSYKMVSAIGKVKGHLVQDRLAGIRGVLGAGAPTVPITTVSIAGSNTSTAVSHISEELVLAPAVAAQLGSDVLRTLDNAWEGTAKVSWRIEYERNGRVSTLHNVNTYASREMLSELVGWDVSEDIAQLQANPFDDVTIVSIKATTRFAEGYRAGRVSALQIRQSGTWKNVSPGSVMKATRGKTYDFRTVLKAAPGAAGGTQYVPFSVTVPSTVKRTMTLTVSPPAEQWDDPVMEAESFDELIAALNANARGDVVERTASYVKTNGIRSSRTIPLPAPVMIDGGTRISFQLQVSP
ncbi:MAG: hypothetical protein P0Y48_09590 [Candidatus Microbacterium phytovorans]|uniref:Peptidase S55 domain-containing protein n=1 Tax=Candidatus Microbacterium phytovorans TaxID=3121374 RepID=A0AAJ5W0C9_9MICO|nr:hypothetical protein [Microbacterium sp.]WEK12719.1 MAG: hypothetical protein P0Y48_09590 [Microbacterium sp.]